VNPNSQSVIVDRSIRRKSARKVSGSDLAGWAGLCSLPRTWVAVVAVAASSVEVLSAGESFDRLAWLVAFSSSLLAENERLMGEVARLAGENERLRARVGKLEGQLEEARRAGKRQAAPFSRGEPKSVVGRPGRRSGEEHGRHGHREPLGEVDEEFEAPLGSR
jgi:hypothetical protein